MDDKNSSNQRSNLVKSQFEHDNSSKYQAGQIQITLPDSITHRFANGLRFGFLFGIGLVMGLIITTVIILGIVGVLAWQISP